MNHKKISLTALLLCVFMGSSLVSCDKIFPSNLIGSSTPSNIPSQSETTESNKESSTPIVSTPEEESSTPIEDSTTDETTTPEEVYQKVTVAEAIEIANQAGETTTTELYELTATVKEIESYQYGSMTLKDETGEIYAYGIYGQNGEFFDKLESAPGKGDIVTILCNLKMYGDTPEIYKGYIQSFVDVPEEEVDISSYTEMSIAQAREAEKDSKVVVEGKVASITYAFGMVPSGVYLVDGASSIYVYSKDVANNVKVGNNIKVAGNKTYYILEDEVNNAKKFGYNGMCQLADAQLVSKDASTEGFDKTLFPEITIKELMDTPVSENITTQIYKVTSYVKKVDGSNFVNYYFNDLDGYTGTYAYSQCSGSDYSWIDGFDGKICTVYLAAHNAKATASDCFFRFVPIAIYDENFKFDLANAPQFAIDYYADGQFKTLYEADPELEVVTSVSSELLGFENVSLTYASNNESSVYFETVEGKLIMHTKDEGKATVTVTASYQAYPVATATYEITVQEPVTYETITVSEAIAATDGTEVIVQGIVLSSLVNKCGFFIYDETGIIAVQVSESELAKVELGNMVIIKGTRAHNKKPESTAITGQSNINNAEVLVNLYGKHEYSTEKFDATKTFTDLYNLDKNVDYSTTPFIVKGKLEYVDAGYYTSLNFKSEDGSSKLTLYMSGAGQYACFKDYYNQVLTFEIIPTNWNYKNFWTFCIIAIVTEDGKVMNNSNWYVPEQ